jgi:hypothetical protein
MCLLKGLADRVRGRVAGSDARGVRVLLVAHCALNQNARVAGAAVRPAALAELVAGLFARDVGIAQMPCPEVCAFGLDRADLCIERELRTPAGGALCRKLVCEQLWQIRAYQAAGVRVLGCWGRTARRAAAWRRLGAAGFVLARGLSFRPLRRSFGRRGSRSAWRVPLTGSLPARWRWSTAGFPPTAPEPRLD